MRRLITFASAVAGLACANMVAPAGGPQRKLPPELLSVTPESGAVNVTDKNAVFSFDVIVNDRAGRNGTLAGSFVVSPGAGTIVNWRRDRIEVRPKGGFLPGTAYSITMLPGVSDLNSNPIKTTRVLTFSTGPSIPPYAIHGRAFDWMSEKIAVDARIDIVRLPDSLPYVGVTDSAGQFSVGPLDTGTYTVRALMDNNRNGLRDSNEPWDTTRVVVRTESPFVELRAAIRDTLPARILTVAPLDSLTLAASFDRPLDPATTLSAASFRVQRADSTIVTVARVSTQQQFRQVRAARDSVRDAARRDSIAKADTSTARPAPPVTAAQRAPEALVVAPKPSVRAPARDVVIELDAATPLQPLNAYRVTAIDIRSLTGVLRSSDRVITMPKRDTTKAPAKNP